MATGRERCGRERNDLVRMDRSPCSYIPGDFDVLLDRGADLILQEKPACAILTQQASYGRVSIVARLLQEPRIRAAVNMQYRYGYTALHYACLGDQATSIVHLLLQSSADPNITDDEGLTF